MKAIIMAPSLPGSSASTINRFFASLARLHSVDTKFSLSVSAPSFPPRPPQADEASMTSGVTGEKILYPVISAPISPCSTGGSTDFRSEARWKVQNQGRRKGMNEAALQARALFLSSDSKRRRERITAAVTAACTVVLACLHFATNAAVSSSVSSSGCSLVFSLTSSSSSSFPFPPCDDEEASTAAEDSSSHFFFFSPSALLVFSLFATTAGESPSPGQYRELKRTSRSSSAHSAAVRNLPGCILSSCR
mmetsp:Transcript_8551/g.16781  ORF Transcript_8551/g.16781 Transcript_8551/m.16781 type:complete len:249 (+) Transcript_8551:511-1257(+)